MIQDSRPVFAQAKSGFKIAGILVVVFVALLLLLSFLPVYRIQAWAWHWRHGNSIQVGDFRVPVPNEWLVQHVETGMTQEVRLANTKGPKPFWAVITITEDQRPKNGVAADWTSSRRRMMENTGIHVTDTRDVVIDGVPGSCLEGETAMAGIPVRNISCHLGASFSLEYIGGSLKAPSFYSILNGISKASRG